MWIARNKDGSLTLHNKKPIQNNNGQFCTVTTTPDKKYSISKGLVMEAADNLLEFSHVTTANSPVEVEVHVFLKNKKL